MEETKTTKGQRGVDRLRSCHQGAGHSTQATTVRGDLRGVSPLNATIYNPSSRRVRETGESTGAGVGVSSG